MGAGVYSGLSSVYGHYYGKREAEAEPYTVGQVHAGLPLVNAYATGHPHNVGYTTNVGYTHYPYLTTATATPATTTDKSPEDRKPKPIGPNVAPWWRKPAVLLNCVTRAMNQING